MTRQLTVPFPAPAPSRPRMTYEEFVRAEWENPHVKWVNGEVVEMPPIGDAHADLNDFLRAIVRIFVERRKLGVVRSDPFNMKLHPGLPGRAPDLMFVARANVRRILRTHLDGAADAVVEIVSPGSRGVDRGNKFYEYEQGGVREYWLIDPAREQAEFFALKRTGKGRLFKPIPVGTDGIFRSTVIKGFWLNVNWMWQQPLPDVLDTARQINGD